HIGGLNVGGQSATKTSANPATINGTVAWSTNLPTPLSWLGHSLTFDGSTTYVSATSTIGGAQTVYTIEGWFYQTTTGAQNFLVQQLNIQIAVQISGAFVAL